EANRPWSDEERQAVLDAAPPHMRSAIGLMMFTGLAPKDALQLTRSLFKQGEIATRRSKTGEPVFWPAPAALIDVLTTAPKQRRYTLRQLPWSALDAKRLSRFVADTSGGPRTAWTCRTRSDAVWASAHRRGDFKGNGRRRAHHCRCLRAENDRDGSSLCEG